MITTRKVLLITSNKNVVKKLRKFEAISEVKNENEKERVWKLNKTPILRTSKNAHELNDAVLIPFDEIEANLDKLPTDKTIALYCNTGTKSGEVAKQLEGLGYTDVVNAIEGVKEYTFKLIK